MDNDTSDKEKSPPFDVKYYAVVLTYTGEFTAEEFDTIDALAARIKELIDHDVSVFSFAGTRLQISKSPFRHLMTPWGNIPLFDVPAALEPDDTGYLGVDPIHLEAPPEIKQPGAGQSSIKNDDFFSDDEDSPLSVFDNVLPDPDS